MSKRVVLDSTCGFSISQLLAYLDENTNDVAELCCVGDSSESSFNITEDDVRDICKVFLQDASKTNLERLQFAQTSLSTRAAEPLAQLLFANTTVQELDLRHNELGSEGLETLIQPLVQTNKTLRILVLKNNHLTPKGGTLVGRLLRYSKTITHLHLGNNDLGVRGIKAFAPTLSVCTSLTHLYLGHNHLGPRGISFLTQALSNGNNNQHGGGGNGYITHSLVLLDLTCNQIGNKGLKNLLSWLLHDKQLQYLWLSSNELQGSTCGGILGSILLHNYTLRQVRLGGNHLGNDGLKELAAGLGKNSGLTHLELDWNRIGNDGATSCALALKQNATLQHVDLSGNHISSTTEIAKSLPSTTEMQQLNLASNQLDDEAVVELSKALLVVPDHFQVLNVADNAEVTQVGISALDQVFQYKSNLQRWLRKLLYELETGRRHHVKSINWLNKQVGNYELDRLCQTLQSANDAGSYITSIYIGGKDLTSMDSLCTWLESTASNVKRLYIRDSCIGNEGATRLAAVLQSETSRLEILSLTSSGISARGASELASSLRRQQRIRGKTNGSPCPARLVRLNLGNNNIGDNGFLQIAQALQQDGNGSSSPPLATGLSSLNLSGNNIQGDLPEIWEALVQVVSLTELNLADNDLTDRVLLDLARALLEPACPLATSLQLLNLCGNPRVTEKGVLALGKFLSETVTIQH